MSDEQGLVKLQRSRKALSAAIEQAVSVVEHSYLEQLDKLRIQPLCDHDQASFIKLAQHGRLYQLTHIVYNKDESFLEKLITVVNTAASLGGTLLTIIRSKGGSISYYLGILSKRDHKKQSKQQAIKDAFSGVVRGNFVGSSLIELTEEDLTAVENDIFCLQPSADGELISDIQSVASVSGVVTLRGKATDGLSSYVQGIENLTDALGEKDYTIMMIADPVSSTEVQDTIRGYERIYTELSTFAQTQLSISEQGSHTLSNAQTKSITTGIMEGVTHTQSVGTTKGKSLGMSAGVHANVGLPNILGVGVSMGVNAGFSTSTTVTQSDGNNYAKTEQEMEQNTRSVAETMGTGKSIQITIKDRSIQSLMEQIDQYIKRLNSCKSYGAFNCAAYVLSEREENTLSAASIYNALMRGEGSSIQTAQIGSWNAYDPELSTLIQYLRVYTHPRFFMEQSTQVTVTPASLISGRELAIQFGLPKKSIQGLTVTEMAAFGRNVSISPRRPVHLGEIYHMGRNTGKELSLDAGSLTSHMFVTGSTGAGKSNAIYTLLRGLCLLENPPAHFLVIEPAKGEYKDALGGYPDVAVYGTNPAKTRLLCLNPFSFPDDIHILEHIDRLVEIFNACWPMYAAMPAVLKAAIEYAYTSCGWSLSTSASLSGLYPTFRDVMRALPLVVDSKGFSRDTQGDYKGALLTRIESLTNGINGQLLCAGDELSAEDLFDKNVIVDLSRVGSSETKALLMGILVLKLQEYRMAQRADQDAKANSGLQHITVLEEAHTLLRSTAQGHAQESANLQSKSVEMLTNAIAEMRTYGEGFIIADQAPGLLDLAAIRNTNTKLILRLPDEGDRQLVGRAAGLNSAQIEELARLDTGTAAVYQNGWLEPVLCKVDHFDGSKCFAYMPIQPQSTVHQVNELFFRRLLNRGIREPLSNKDTAYLRRWITQLDTGTDAKQMLLGAAEGTQLTEHDMMYALYCALKGKDIILESENLVYPKLRDAYIEARIRERMLVSSDTAARIHKVILAYVSLHQAQAVRFEKRGIR